MSTTRKQLGKTEGYYCCDPSEFTNPGQDTSGRPNNDGHSVRAATSSPGTITSGGNTADGNVKTSAQPRVGELKGVNKVQVEPRSYTELKGR